MQKSDARAGFLAGIEGLSSVVATVKILLKPYGLSEVAQTEPVTSSGAGILQESTEPSTRGKKWTIPGSNLQSPAAVARFRETIRCVSSKGKWVLDPTPRPLPWPLDEGNMGHCDGRWMEQEKVVKQGRLAGALADDVSWRKLPPDAWKVRSSLKYVWRTDRRECPGGPDLGSAAGSDVLRSLLASADDVSRKRLQEVVPGERGGGRTSELKGKGKFDQDKANAGKPGHGNVNGNVDGEGGPQDGISCAAERVMLVVGDSTQYAIAHSLVDNMRMEAAVYPGGAFAVVHLNSTALPCYEKKLVHRKTCWGVKFSLTSFFRPNEAAGLRTKGSSARNVTVCLKLIFVRNDYLTLVTKADWTGDGKHCQLPWLKALGHFQRQGMGVRPGQNAQAQGSRDSEQRSLDPIVVLNRGMHFAQDELFFAEVNQSLQAVRGQCPSCLVFFRNSAGGHKGCKDDALPLSQQPERTGLPYSWGSIIAQSRNPRLRDIVEDAGAVFLDIETMTSFRADGHTVKNRKGKADCIHYCAPGPVDSWTQLLFLALEGLSK